MGAIPPPDFRALFESAPGMFLVLAPDLRIVAVSDAYLRATMTRREDILGRGLFDVFPDNPDDPSASGVRNLKASLDRVLRHRIADTMALQKYDIRRPDAEGGEFEERHWAPVNSPVLGKDGNIAYIIHRVEDVTEFVRLKQVGAEQAQAAAGLRERAQHMEAEVFRRARELAEANRRRKELETFIEQAPVGLAMFDRRMRYLQASRRWMEDCGVTGRDVVGKSHYEIFPDLPEDWKEAHRRGLAGESLKGQDDWVALDGERHSIRWEIQPWGDSGVDTGGIIIFIEDTTEGKTTAEALEQSEARFRSMYEHAAVGIEQVGIDGRLLMVNAALCRMLGMDEAELLARTFVDITHPESHGPEAALVEQLLRGERDWFEIDKRYLHRDGSPVWVHVTSSLVRDAGRRPLYRISVIQDIRERKQAEEALRTGEERLAAVIGTAMDAIITVDTEEQILLFNAAAETIFGCPAGDAIGGRLDRFLPERLRAAHGAHIRRFGATGETARSMNSLGTVLGRRANGEEFPAEATISQARIGGQKLYTVILRDITQRRQAEELARLYEQSKELDRLRTEFIANVSHDLRTPLTLILAPVRKRLAEPGIVEAERRDMELIERNALVLLRHVNDLLDLAKIDAGRMAPDYAETDLARLVRRAASQFGSLAAERGLALRIDAPGPIAAEVDAGKIERALVNLLSNAFKFTPEGGAVRVAAYGRGDRAIIEVEDSGPGIPASMREAIFERFRQLDGGSGRRRGGTGLGLAIVRQFVELHGGSVRVEEAPASSGSLFRMEIPLRAPDGATVRLGKAESDVDSARQAAGQLRAAERRRPPEAADPDPERPIVLLVEDNADMNAFLAEMLSPYYRVHCAFDGREGIEKALAVRPDLILTDLMMPRMSGDVLVAELRRREEFADVPIVLLTAHADEEMRVRLLQEGAQDYLHKPFDTRTTLAKLERLIADRRRRQQAEEAMHRLSGGLLEAHDEERRRVAVELHENTIQCLAALQMYLDMARDPSADAGAEGPLGEGMAILERCLSDVRELSQTLHPQLLDNLGLRAALDWHVKGIARSRGIQASLDIPQDFGRLPSEAELTLFRTAQEALVHARGARVAVRAFRLEREAGVEILAPDGGFSPEGELGIATIRERVRKLGGRFEIDADELRIRAVVPAPAPLP